MSVEPAPFRIDPAHAGTWSRSHGVPCHVAGTGSTGGERTSRTVSLDSSCVDRAELRRVRAG